VEEKVTPLSVVKPGKEVTLISLSAGRGLQSRLFSLGLVPGVTVKVLGNHHPGPIRISIKDTRLAIGWGIAQKIMVSE
jgi:ferrous iron transport protein A